jgi:hypothetical protein
MDKIVVILALILAETVALTALAMAIRLPL